MNICCTICRELMNESENIHGTPCGHVFHHQCLSQWISRSQTCPQCRNTVTENCTARIYLAIWNEHDFGTFTLHNEIPVRVELRSPTEQYETIQSLMRDVQKLKDEIEVMKKNIEDSGSIIDSQNRVINKLKDGMKVVENNIQLCGRGVMTCHKCSRTFRAKLDYLNHMRAHERAEQRAERRRAAQN